MLNIKYLHKSKAKLFECRILWQAQAYHIDKAPGTFEPYYAKSGNE